MKKRLPVLLLILMLVLSGCGIKNKSQTILYDLTDAPRSLDPQTADDRASLLVIHNIFEGLYRLAPDGTVEPAVAEALPEISENGLVYTIILRDDAVWSDGTPVTAGDFVFAFRRLVMPETRSPGASAFTCLENAEAILSGQAAPEALGAIALSDRKLVLRLHTQNSNFLFSLTTGYAMPCNPTFFYNTKGKYGLQASKVLENGPFTVSRWVDEDGLLRLGKNEKYRLAGEVEPSAVQFTVDSGADLPERLSSLKTMAALTDAATLSQLDEKDFSVTPLTRKTWTVALNQKNEITGNALIRKALAACFDRTAYASLLDDHQKNADGLIPPALWVYTAQYRKQAGPAPIPSFSPSEALSLYRQGLEELQIDQLPALTLLLTESTDPAVVSCFSHAAQVWQRELSVYVNLEKVDASTYRQRVAAGDFDLLLTSLSSSDDSVGQFLDVFSVGNTIGYESPDFQALLLEASVARDGETALSCYREAETQLLTEGVLLPMFYVTDSFTVSNRVTGLLYHPITGIPLFRSAILR